MVEADDKKGNRVGRRKDTRNIKGIMMNWISDQKEDEVTKRH